MAPPDARPGDSGPIIRSTNIRLEKLLPQVEDPDLAAQTRTFLEQIKKDAARLGSL